MGSDKFPITKMKVSDGKKFKNVTNKEEIQDVFLRCYM